MPGEFSVAICDTCGAGTTFPRGERIELAAYYPPAYGAHGVPTGALSVRISSAIRAWQAWRLPRSEPLAELRNRVPGSLLDVGCGRGDLAATMAAVGWSAAGIEPSPEARSTASSRGVRILGATVAEARLGEERFDAVVMRHSLEHLPDPVADLQRLAGALRPNGRLLVSVPNFDSWQRRRFGDRWYHLDLPRHRVHFGEQALRTALERAGLEVVRTSTSTSAVGLAGTLQFATVGRFVATSGISLRIANGLSAVLWPIAAACDRLGGGGDERHAVAGRRAP